MLCLYRTQNDTDVMTALGSRQRGPLGEQLTDAELAPIRVHEKRGAWQVDYGSYAQGYHATREEAIEAAVTRADYENRELTVERPREPTEATVAA